MSFTFRRTLGSEDIAATTTCCLHFSNRIGKLGLLLLWHFAHFVVRIWYFVLAIAQTLESHLIARGVFEEYKTLNIKKLHYLAIVVESEEAYKTSKVIELLKWLADIGVKHVCLYDSEGVLKKSKEIILGNSNATFWEVLSWCSYSSQKSF